MSFELKIYGAVPQQAEQRSVESYEALLERYPWFNAARRLTQKQGDRLPANILLANYFRPPQERFNKVSGVRCQVSESVERVPGVGYQVSEEDNAQLSDAERVAAEAIVRREEQRTRRADADEVDFPTTSGISAGGEDNAPEWSAEDIIAAFMAGGEHRIEFAQVTEKPVQLPTPDNDPVLRTVMEFLAMEDYKIDPDECAPTPSKERLESAVDLSSSDFASEELAAIYLKQSLLDEAQKIYSQLSLQNSEKSAYFAALIAEAKAKVEAKKAEKTKGLKR